MQLNVTRAWTAIHYYNDFVLLVKHRLLQLSRSENIFKHQRLSILAFFNATLGLLQPMLLFLIKNFIGTFFQRVYFKEKNNYHNIIFHFRVVLCTSYIINKIYNYYQVGNLKNRPKSIARKKYV